MSRRTTVGIAISVALGCVGGAYYLLHGRSNGPRPAMAATSTPAPARSTEKPVSTETPRALADTKKIVLPPESGLVLRPGEILEYTANVSKLNNVANLKLQVAERRDFLGKTAWHLQAFAHTENPLRMVFELDDQFDSYSDAGSLASLQYEMHLSERGQKVESVQRMTATGKEPAPPDATATQVLPGTRDPLGMMEYLRGVDWAKTPEVRSPVYDGHRLYDVRAKLAGPSEAVTVPAGNYTASKIEIRVFDDGEEMKDTHFSLYLANTAEKTPVLLEAVMPVATARVELTKSR